MTPIHRVASTTVVLALAFGAQAAPAGAWISNVNAHGSYVPALTVKTQAPGGASAKPTILQVGSQTGGFDWSDAGIGAAGGIAISLVGIGTAIAASGRRPRRATGRRA